MKVIYIFSILHCIKEEFQFILHKYFILQCRKIFTSKFLSPNKFL